MKKTLTLLIFLLACLKLSAAIQSVDTVKIGPTDSSKDTIKSPTLVYNIKSLALSDFVIAARNKNSFGVATVNHYPDQLTSIIPVKHNEDVNVVAVTYPDSMNLAPLLKKPVSLSMSDSHLAENLNNKIRIKNADSLRLLAAMLRQDSVRISLYRANKDSVKQRLAVMNLDSLKLQLKYPASDMFKGQIYTEIANRYLDYDTISNKMQRASYENKALNYTMLALHQFSYYNDTTGLRITFDHLAKVYMAQKKFSQAKWFILQSNSLSRAKNDQLNIISSLVTLAKIKSEQTDYKLAMGDLDEAIQISEKNHYGKVELDVLKNYALLYSRMKNYPKEEAMLKKRDSLEQSIHKAEEAKLTAALAAKDSMEKKKADSLQVKKKVFSSNTRKLSKNGSGKKVVTL